MTSASYNRVFSETSIERNIRYRRLGTLHEESSNEHLAPLTNGTSPTASSPDTEATNHDRSGGGSPFSSSTTLNLPDEAPSTSLDPLTHNYTDPEKVNAATLDSNMYTAGMPPLDLLIRTSGVERLSDFMLWQCHENTSVVFVKCLWPQFDMWQFLPILVEWQWWRRKSGSLDHGLLVDR